MKTNTFLKKSQMKCENVEMLDSGEICFEAIIFCLHGQGSISKNSNGKRFKKQDSLDQTNATNIAMCHLNIFLLFKLGSRCAVVDKDQEPRDD